ncbi:DNA-binding transcriptional regulator, IclR family [Salinihabitans flavidus]|uniref:DNA-binding transcriptional regulator, IclR family n=1 Tax=Salinihabitans flavidus TaxID=569882 RepID=A0A1H8PIZ9_9RHOB|nr:IclR family transcriptional regulator [Salinihabitans flavidus]SEO41895.1 DNA-binding transcriptional regulator, IclR family [Salinihabitans flavidus]
MAEAQISSVKTIGRAALVLRALSAGPAGGMRLADVTAAVDLGKATVHRLLGALTDVGFVEFDEGSKLYRLGYGLFSLAAAAQRFSIVEQARPSLVRLAAATEDTVYLSVREGDQALCVDRCTGKFPIRTLTLDVGDRRPLGVGAGSLALLAFQPEDDIDRILRDDHAARQGFDGFGEDSLREMVRATQRDGYAFNGGRIVSAMAAVGVPVKDRDGRALAALSLAAIRERMDPPRVSDLVGMLRHEAEELGRTLHQRGQAPAGAGQGKVREEQV